METTAKRAKRPPLSPVGERILVQYERRLRSEEDLTAVTIRNLRHRFGYRMATAVPLHRLAQLMGHDSLDTTMIYVQATRHDLQKEVEKIAWI